jgi:molybdopterin synthase catalytic subunit
MHLEYYEGMTEKHLNEICTEAKKKWDILDLLIMHRVGQINIGDPIVLVCVWTVHRADAFAACRFIMEDLKSRAPFWKQEKLTAGKRWVDKNTPG